jgi:maltooligosyltrehalose trehalohydrolase
LTSDPFPWRRPLGARPVGDGLAEFRVWAPRPRTVRLRVRDGRGAARPAADREHPLEPAGHGVWEARAPARAGDRYSFVLDGRALPDPCTRSQPEGLRGPSELVDPGTWTWTDERWGGVPLRDLVIYELHVGAFTREGTFDAAVGHLRELRELGITALELMPVAAGPGERGWGYDGVYPWAAHAAYGGPAGLQRLVDAAHAHGMAVLLDLVLNHVGASGGGALTAYGPYFTDRYGTFWGDAINYDDADSDPVREWAIQGACAWVRDLHVDGFRLDAVHSVYDSGARHVLAELASRVREEDPRALVVSESGLNDPKVIRPPEVGGWGHDAQWADDFHHAARVLLTGERDGYYADFGDLGQLAKAFRRPFVHDGSWSGFRRRVFGAPAGDRPPEQFVVFAQNHDQVGNRAFGDRLPAAARPLAALLVALSPFTPLLFMGEEYGEERPFLFFTDHIDPDIAEATREGRRREFASFASWAEEVPDPQDPATFERSKLSRAGDPALRRLWGEALRLRRGLPRESGDVAWDEEARWLRVERGPCELVANFGPAEAAVPARGREVVLATHEARVEDGSVRLAALGGAVVR